MDGAQLGLLAQQRPGGPQAGGRQSHENRQAFTMLRDIQGWFWHIMVEQQLPRSAEWAQLSGASPSGGYATKTN